MLATLFYRGDGRQRGWHSFGGYHVTTLPVADRIAYFVLPMFLSLVFLMTSLWIFGLRRAREPAGRAFSIMTTSLAIVSRHPFRPVTTHKFTYAWTMAAGFSGGALIDMALCFPQEVRLLFRRPYWRWLGYAIGIGLAINAYRKLYDFRIPPPTSAPGSSSMFL